MASTALCYLADEATLFPSVASLDLALKNHPTADVSAFIFAVDAPDEALARFKTACASRRIELIGLGSRDLDGARTFAGASERPPAGLARFSIGRMLPKSVRQIIFFNGNTLAVGDLGRLLAQEIEPGRVLAAENSLSFLRKEDSPFAADVRSYFSGLGLSGDDGYADVGVLKAERSTWTSVSNDALSFLASHPERCRHRDQSALNATIKSRRVSLSAKYNFETAFLLWGLERRVAPSLYHFSQAGPPWLGRCSPWSRFDSFYRAFAKASPDLPLKVMSELERRRHQLRVARQTVVLRGPNLMRLLARRQAFWDYHRGVAWT